MIKLTKSEKLYLNRKRNNLTQAQMAHKCGVGLTKYSAMELGLIEVEFKVYDLKPTKVEEFVLLRRRKGKTQTDLASELGYTKAWINKIEKGLAKTDLLERYWSDKD